MKNLKLILVSISICFLGIILFYRFYEKIESIDKSNTDTQLNINNTNDNINVVKKFIDEMNQFGHTETEIVKNLGPPISVKRHEGATGLVYDGLYIMTWQDEFHSEYVNYVCLTSEKYNTGMGIKIGSLKEEVIKIFGKPTKSDGNIIAYIHDMVVTEGIIRFYLSNGIVSKIEWDIGTI